MPHFFGTPTEACSWALSRFKRDGLSNICGYGVYPEFIKFVGVLEIDKSSFKESVQKDIFSSKKETEFFKGCKFLHILNMDNSILSYERIDPTGSLYYLKNHSMQVWTINSPQTPPTRQGFQPCLIPSLRPTMKSTTSYGSCKQVLQTISYDSRLLADT